MGALYVQRFPIVRKLIRKNAIVEYLDINYAIVPMSAI